MFPMKDIDLAYFDTADLRFETTVELNCTPERLFDIFEDAESWPIWVGSITHVEWTSPKPYDIGTTRTVTMQGGLEGYEEFIAWERGSRMAFKFVGANKDNIEVFGEDYIVKDLGNGRCELTWVVVMEPKGLGKFFMKLGKPIMGKMFANIMQKSLPKYIADNPV